jgi:hypothetical protein
MSDRGSSNTKGRLVAVWQPSFESPERHSLCFHDGTERPLFRKRSLLRLPRITHTPLAHHVSISGGPHAFKHRRVALVRARHSS